MQLAQRKGNVLTSLYYYCVVLAMLQIDFVEYESSWIKKYNHQLLEIIASMAYF